MNLALILPIPHPGIPHAGPLDDPKLRGSRVLQRGTLAQELAVPHAPLLPQGRAVLLPNEAVELALDALEPAPLTAGELAVEALPHLLPLLVEVDPVVPDEVHLLFLVLGTRGPALVGVGGGAGRDGVVAVSGLGVRGRVCG